MKISLHHNKMNHLALVLTRLTLPAFWMGRGKTRFWIPTSVTSAEPGDDDDKEEDQADDGSGGSDDDDCGEW